MVRITSKYGDVNIKIHIHALIVFWPKLTLISVGQVVHCQLVMAHCLHGYLPKKHCLSAPITRWKRTSFIYTNYQNHANINWYRSIVLKSEWRDSGRQLEAVDQPPLPTHSWTGPLPRHFLPPFSQSQRSSWQVFLWASRGSATAFAPRDKTKHIVVGMDPIVPLLTLIW